MGGKKKKDRNRKKEPCENMERAKTTQREREKKIPFCKSREERLPGSVTVPRILKKEGTYQET